MARGRKRLPSNVLDARGSFANHPERRRQDVQVDSPIGKPFSWMPARAKKIWREVAGNCPGTWLRITDRYSFARYCLLVERLIEGELAGEGARQLAQLETRFGFTPTERARIGAANTKPAKQSLRDALGKA